MQNKTADLIKISFVTLVIIFEGFFKTKSLEIPAEKNEMANRYATWNNLYLAELNTIAIQLQQFCK